jgi:hypothetical protein
MPAVNCAKAALAINRKMDNKKNKRLNDMHLGMAASYQGV